MLGFQRAIKAWHYDVMENLTAKQIIQYENKEMRMDFDHLFHMAQKISFAFEDTYSDDSRRKKFIALFNRYLSGVDPVGIMEPYDAIIKLGRKNPEDFDRMVLEMKENALLSD